VFTKCGVVLKQGKFCKIDHGRTTTYNGMYFDSISPRISAYEIHEWIHEQLHISEPSLTMIQIDGIKRHVFLKFVDDIYIQNILQSTNGSAEDRHVIGEISIVRLEVAGMGMRRIRIANLLPEVTERSTRAALASYGETVSIQDYILPKAYRYKVANEVKVIVMKLAKHIPSQMNIAGHRSLPSYEDQPVTCQGCGDSGHINQA